MRRTLLCFALAVLFQTPVSALEMKTLTDNENLAHVFLWGKIEVGDDEKFRQIILPLVRSGTLIWEVNIFSSGGNVPAAMGIGRQIRMLNTRTKGPNQFYDRRGGQWVQRNEVSCWFMTSMSGAVFTTEKEIVTRHVNSGTNAWCDCASACLLIWASGITREGNRIGLHRPYFDAKYFATLSPLEARELYARMQTEYRSYLERLDVPATLLDRLFATDSKSVYYLSKSELELMQSTPYLEELTQAKCGDDKTKRVITANSWATTYDAQHIQCYREILKQLMRAGVQNYLNEAVNEGKGTALSR